MKTTKIEKITLTENETEWLKERALSADLVLEALYLNLEPDNEAFCFEKWTKHNDYQKVEFKLFSGDSAFVIIYDRDNNEIIREHRFNTSEEAFRFFIDYKFSIEYHSKFKLVSYWVFAICFQIFFVIPYVLYRYLTIKDLNKLGNKTPKKLFTSLGLDYVLFSDYKGVFYSLFIGIIVGAISVISFM